MAYFDKLIVIANQWKHLGAIDDADGGQLIGHVPHIAEFAYLHGIFSPLDQDGIEKIEIKLAKRLPDFLSNFYRKANGLRLFSGNIVVYGLRLDYDRSDFIKASLQPFDIWAPNVPERPVNANIDNLFFGFYQYDGSEVFCDKTGAVFRCKMGDVSHIYNRWENFESWLLSESMRLGGIFNENGVCLDSEKILPRSRMSRLGLA